jgi:protein involved in polysaccharide export with SLBB domain
MKLILLLTLMIVSFAQAKIIKGDTLTIMIKGVPQEEQVQINGAYQVSPANELFLPYLTDTPIGTSGQTTTSLARRIEAAYKEAQIYTTPTISIQSLFEQNEKAKKRDKITTDEIQKYLTVSGQVGRPGPQLYRPGLRLIDVVAQASPTTFAAQNRVELLRNGKIYKYDMRIPAHMVEKVYVNDKITLKEKNWRGQ